jgi:prepilin-type N-terminal cleavage/methylation domain-containing protein
MMTGRKQVGFTLVELLVVVVIISMLMGLLLPAILRSRETARRAKCASNQHELGMATMSYDTANNHFPGVVNALGPVVSGTWQFSWATALLPYLQREDAWNNWKLMMTGQAPSGTALWTGNLPQMVCPSTDVVNGGLNYVANCGSSDSSTFLASNGVQTVNETTAGVFLDYYNVPTMPRMSASNIKDGTSMTLMFSENLQTGNWMGGPLNTGTLGSPNLWNGTVQYNLVGMFWTASPSTTKGLYINIGNADLGYPQSATDYSHARPASNHPNGVVVTYCDGHQAFLAQDDINYTVYAQLMAPDDLGAGLTPMTTPPPQP